jgi:hypothetical protein
MFDELESLRVPFWIAGCMGCWKSISQICQKNTIHVSNYMPNTSSHYKFAGLGSDASVYLGKDINFHDISFTVFGNRNEKEILPFGRKYAGIR